MRTYGALHPIDQIEGPPDTVDTFFAEAGGPEGLDWPANTHLAKFSGMTTAGVALNFMVNMTSTGANDVATGTSIGDVQVPVIGSRTFQVPGDSTGYSVGLMDSASGRVVVEMWRK